MIHARLFTAQPKEFHVIIGGKAASPDPTRMAWFIVYAPAREFEAEAALVEMAEKGLSIDAYCPALTKWQDTQRQRFRVQEALYPGYLFVGLAATSHGPGGAEYPFDAVLAVEGVSAILGSDGKPVRVPYDLTYADFVRFIERDPEAMWSVFGLRLLEGGLAFDFTRGVAHSRKATKAVRRARRALGVAFRGLDNPEWAATWLTANGASDAA